LPWTELAVDLPVILTHRIIAHLNPIRVMNQTIQDADHPLLFDGNQLELAVPEFHFADRAMRTQGTKRLSVGANGQTARIAGPQNRRFPDIHALDAAGFD